MEFIDTPEPLKKLRQLELNIKILTAACHTIKTNPQLFDAEDIRVSESQLQNMTSALKNHCTTELSNISSAVHFANTFSENVASRSTIINGMALTQELKQFLLAKQFRLALHAKEMNRLALLYKENA